MTPAGVRPASRARSTAASVWPARRRTPPSLATSGNRWPGLRRSVARVAGSAIARTVRARSAALMPVEQETEVGRDRVLSPVRILVLVDHRLEFEPRGREVRHDRHAELSLARG